MCMSKTKMSLSGMFIAWTSCRKSSISFSASATTARLSFEVNKLRFADEKFAYAV